MVDILHVRDRAQALDHRVVKHDDDGLVALQTRQPTGHLAGYRDCICVGLPQTRSAFPMNSVIYPGRTDCDRHCHSVVHRPSLRECAMGCHRC